MQASSLRAPPPAGRPHAAARAMPRNHTQRNQKPTQTHAQRAAAAASRRRTIPPSGLSAAALVDAAPPLAATSQRATGGREEADTEDRSHLRMHAPGDGTTPRAATGDQRAERDAHSHSPPPVCHARRGCVPVLSASSRSAPLSLVPRCDECAPPAFAQAGASAVLAADSPHAPRIYDGRQKGTKRFSSCRFRSCRC